MKTKLVVCLGAILVPLLSFADDFSLSDGREYKGVTVSRVEADGVVVITNDGVEKLPFSLMPKEVRDAYPYKPTPTPTPMPVAPVPAAAAPVESGSDMASPVAVPETTGSATQLEPKATASPVPATDGKESKYRCMAAVSRLAEPLVVSIVALGLGWLIARGLMLSWLRRAEQRGFDLANATEFHGAYAEFFAVWKLWNYCSERSENDLPGHEEYELPHAARWELLARASAAEGVLEKLFLKLSTDGTLDSDDVELLGRFRQAFQTLGNAIRQNKSLAWNTPDHPEYVAFRNLASSVAHVIEGETPGIKELEQRANILRDITSARWERNWSAMGSQDVSKDAPPGKRE